MESKKYDTTNIPTKQKQTHRHRDQPCVFQGGERWAVDEEEKDWEFGISRSKLLYIYKKVTRSYCITQGTIFNIL